MPKVIPLKIKSRGGSRSSIEIEDVQEAFCGSRRKNLVPLADAAPEVAAEWLYAKNAGWGPEDFSRGSTVKAWWECSKCKRSYKAAIVDRTSRKPGGCPYCASKKLCSDNSFAILFPEMAAEWHPTKNKKLKVTEVMFGSHTRVWWLCKTCNQSWTAEVKTRTGFGLGCPACAEKKLSEYVDYLPRDEKGRVVLGPDSKKGMRIGHDIRKRDYLSVSKTHPRVARQWHPVNNGEFKASDFPPRSSVVAWWQCRKDVNHEWQSSLVSRTNTPNDTCPYCSNQKVSATNSLQAKLPELAKEWHPTRNKSLQPDQVVAGSTMKVWWRCREDERHQWQAQIANRANGNGCPYCAGRRVSDLNSLAKRFPKIAAQLHPTKNGSLKASKISQASPDLVWWKCKKGPDHEWQATVINRTHGGTNCPACANFQVSVTNSLATLYPHVAKQWDKTKNQGMRPSDIHGRSKKLAWWLCPQGHSWSQRVCDRTRTKGICLYCSGRK